MSLSHQRARPTQCSIATAMLGERRGPAPVTPAPDAARPRRKRMVDSVHPGHLSRRVYT